MRLERIQHGRCEIVEFVGTVAYAIDKFVESGAFDGESPDELISQFFAISDEGENSCRSGQLHAIIQYLPAPGQMWPDLVITKMGPCPDRAIYRMTEISADDGYELRRIY